MTNTKKQTILVTGGAGYIGSHTCVELLEAGFKVIVVDNFSNSSFEAIKRVEILTEKYITTYEADIRDRLTMQEIFTKHSIDAVVHFAGLKSVCESVENPVKYYDNNVHGSLVLLEEMQRAECNIIVFSSSATVYGDPQQLPIKESAPVGNTTNPYGHSKWMIEEILRYLFQAEAHWKISVLRYFNPVGAHESGQIGEDPNGIPDNLMPYIAQVAIGKQDTLQVFGGDYPTSDGTGIRDYIHVVDLAKGHIKALKHLLSQAYGDLITVNLGTGTGTSVIDLIKAFEHASGQSIPFEITDRRVGDIASCYASSVHAKQILNWQAEFDIHRMCEDTWRWQSNNPSGYIAKERVSVDDYADLQSRKKTKNKLKFTEPTKHAF